MNAFILFGLPVHSIMREELSTSITFARNKSATCTISERVVRVAFTFTKISSRATKRVEFGKVFYVYDVHKFVELLNALVNAVSAVLYCHGYARILLSADGPDIESLNIKPPAAEHSGDPCENAEFVFHEC